MNRSRKAVLVSLGVAALLLVTSYILNRILGPTVHVIEHPDQPQSILLEAKPGKGHVYGLELEIRGELTGEAVLLVGASGEPIRTRIRLKPGEVENRYSSDWYFNECLLRYEPQDEVEGELKILYRFIRN